LNVADNSSNPLPEYERPPVIEVVCGVSFAPLQRFKAIHVGLLWDRMREVFPKVEEQAPLEIPVEQLATPPVSVQKFEFVDMPPLPRVWFVDEPGNGIIQVQKDCFLHNWRKLKPEDQYPRFRNVIAAFQRHLATFETFLADSQLGSVAPVQCELTYVNHIFEGPLWSMGQSLDALFPDFERKASPQRFLPTYDAVNWRTAYRLPDQLGRLHTTIQIGFLRPSAKPLVSLEMKARGVGNGRSPEAMWAWFEVAHEWIVRGFTDMTSQKAQEELWGRIK
jgi:uncharacterized protein (TIGR04255 family)